MRIFHSFFNLYIIKYGVKVVVALLFVSLVVSFLRFVSIH